MGLYHFHLPDVGEGVAEAEIIAWHVKPGERVSEDQNLVDVMTDKATVEMTSPVDGVVLAVHGDVGAMVPVGSVLVELEIEGDGNVAADVVSEPEEDPQSFMEGEAPTQGPEVERMPPAAPVRAPIISAAVASSSAPDGRARKIGEVPFASPATRRRAHELGIPLQYVPGTGPGGRILPTDLNAYVAAGGTAGVVPSMSHERTGVEQERVLGLRRKIAEKMQDAKRRIPHIAYVEEIDVTELEALRQDLNAHRQQDEPKLTLLPFFIRALVQVLPGYSQINARYDDEAGVLHRFEGVHVGIATQTPGGLMVPVVRHAEALDIYGCARELARVTAAARDGSAGREELSGSTITITSLGTLGGVASTPVINHPEVAIIGPNKIMEKPVPQGGFVSVRKIMNLSSSFDHRIVDGYDAALFIQALKRMLEHPALLFMEKTA